jgi:hypothetical protein
MVNGIDRVKIELLSCFVPHFHEPVPYVTVTVAPVLNRPVVSFHAAPILFANLIANSLLPLVLGQMSGHDK